MCHWLDRCRRSSWLAGQGIEAGDIGRRVRADELGAEHRHLSGWGRIAAVSPPVGTESDELSTASFAVRNSV